MKKLSNYALILILVLGLLILPGCTHKPVKETKTIPKRVEETTSQVKDTKKDRYVTIRSIGDILLHDYVYQSAFTENGYQFDSMFESIKPYLQHADITTANLETIAAGDSLGVSTYPLFNAPNSIVTSLKNAGIDIVNNATNHTMDRGVEGALASIENLEDHAMPYVGSYKNWKDYNTPRVLNVNGIKVGFLSYTYGLNGNYLPEDQRYLATLIDKELIPLEIERLKKFCDISIVIFHEGNEYDDYPNENQMALFKLAKDAGANFVIGGHPHVLQPGIKWNDQQGGFYSHGNFLSGQYELKTKIGSIWEYTFKLDKNDQVSLESMKMMPTYNEGYPEYNQYRVIPLRDADEWAVGDVDSLMESIKTIVQAESDSIEFLDYLEK